MSVTITAEPYVYGWARNRNSYKLSCNAVASIGSASHYRFTFSGNLPSAGKHIVISVDGMEYVFTFGSGGGMYDIATVAEIGYKMASCYYLQKMFTATSNTRNALSNFFLELVGLSVGYHNVEIYTTDVSGRRDSGESSLVTNGLSTAGTDRAIKQNYSIAVIVEVVVNDNNTSTTRENKFLFQPNDSGVVDVPLDLMSGMIPQPDIPATNVSGWSLLTNHILKYRIRYGEVWGDNPMVQNMTTGSWKYAICGEVADRFSRLNMPDWNSGINLQLANNSNVLWVIGEDSGASVRIGKTKPEFLYVLWYNTGSSMDATRSITMQIYTLNSSGAETLTSTTSHTVTNGNMYRVAVGPSQLNITGGYYRIVLSGASGSWTRTYIVEDDILEPVTMLLQNKYGLLQCFQMSNTKRELVKESDELIADGRRYLETNDCYEVYKVQSGLMTREEGRRVGMCVGQSYHYMTSDTHWLRVTIEDGSFVMRSDSEGMVTVEFSFRFVENQSENITNGSVGRSISATSADELGAIVAFSDRTAPINNNIL